MKLGCCVGLETSEARLLYKWETSESRQLCRWETSEAIGGCVGGMGEACYLLKDSTQAGWLQYTVFWSLKGQALHSVTELTNKILPIDIFCEIKTAVWVKSYEEVSKLLRSSLKCTYRNNLF